MAPAAGVDVSGEEKYRKITFEKPDGRTSFLIVVSLAGYEEKRLVVTPAPDQNQVLQFQLERIVSAPVTHEPPASKNKRPMLTIESQPAQPVEGDTLTIVLNGTDPDGDPGSLSYYYRRDSSSDWLAANGNELTVPDLKAGPLRLEFLCKHAAGADSDIVVGKFAIGPRPQAPAHAAASTGSSKKPEGVDTDPANPFITWAQVPPTLDARDSNGNDPEWAWRELVFSPELTHIARMRLRGPGDRVTIHRISDGAPERLAEPPVPPPFNDSRALSLPFYCCDFSGDGTLLVAANSIGHAYVWRVNDGQLVRSVKHPRQGRLVLLLRVALSPDGSVVAASFNDGLILVERVADGQILDQFHRDPDDGALRLAFVSTSSLLAFRTKQAIKLRRINEKRFDAAIRCNGSKWSDWAFSPDGQVLATLGRDQKVRLHRLSNAQTDALETDNVLALLTFSGDGRFLASASPEDSKIRIWRVSDGQLLKELDGHTGGVSALRFNADASKLASAGTDKDPTIRFWGVIAP